MSTGWGPTAGNDALTTVTSGFQFIKLHIGDPGAAGTSNPATETARQAVSMAAAAGGSQASNAVLTWTAVAAAEDYTHFSAWTLSAGGVFGYSGTITAPAVTAGATFTIASGSFVVSLTLAS